MRGNPASYAERTKPKEVPNPSPKEPQPSKPTSIPKATGVETEATRSVNKNCPTLKKVGDLVVLSVPPPHTAPEMTFRPLL